MCTHKMGLNLEGGNSDCQGIVRKLHHTAETLRFLAEKFSGTGAIPNVPAPFVVNGTRTYRKYHQQTGMPPCL